MNDNSIDRMNGRIQAPATNPGKGASGPAASGNAGSPTAPAGGADTDDTVRLTPTAQRLAELETTLNGIPDVREGRVSQLRQAIANGTYAPSSERIADRLQAQELALSRNKQ